MLSVFLNFIPRQVVNSIAVRQILLKGAGEIEFNWTLLGFEDDDKVMDPYAPLPGQIGRPGWIHLHVGRRSRRLRAAGDRRGAVATPH